MSKKSIRQIVEATIQDRNAKVALPIQNDILNAVQTVYDERLRSKDYRLSAPELSRKAFHFDIDVILKVARELGFKPETFYEDCYKVRKVRFNVPERVKGEKRTPAQRQLDQFRLECNKAKRADQKERKRIYEEETLQAHKACDEVLQKLKEGTFEVRSTPTSDSVTVDVSIHVKSKNFSEAVHKIMARHNFPNVKIQPFVWLITLKK